MPGSWRNQAGQANIYTAANNTLSTTFLNTWNNTGGALDTTSHRGINSTNGVSGNGTGSDNLGCMTCHSPEGLAATLGIAEGNDMHLFNIGMDLRNDHPVGVTFPITNGLGTDWKTPAGIGKNGMKYFDSGTVSGGLDKADIRIYGTGSGGGAVGVPSATVECASCHDPHGVPDPTNGNKFIPTFLRVNNAGSAVCLTCHTK